ncbi:uncharacterized protein LOC103989368 isoform X1 [Musa acuminata AAA Group]|uniref:uncharacterized protein LOC103989368 isoform X1 n=1 Tax=Musa acuminata AAA Group TaxID=214697 RepID=UPI0031E49345
MRATNREASNDKTSSRIRVLSSHLHSPPPPSRMASSETDAALAATPSDAPTIFDKIIHKEIPSKVVYEDEKLGGVRMEDGPVLLHLLKLRPATSGETLADVLETLWKNRRTGLDSLEKSRIRSLLILPAAQDLDPILACLRLLVRKCVHEKLTGDDIKKLFPHDLSIELQSSLVLLFQKYHNQWNEELSSDQARVSGQAKFNATLGRASSPASEKLPSLWPRQDVTFINNDNFRTSNQIRVDSHPPPLATMVVHQDTSSSRNMETLPRLKSMTWIMQNRNSAPANRVAVITLKLQDYTNSTSGELEVKFQLSKDTLEAMLRTMTYISEQLSSSVEQSSEPSVKKPKQ